MARVIAVTEEAKGDNVLIAPVNKAYGVEYVRSIVDNGGQAEVELSPIPGRGGKDVRLVSETKATLDTNINAVETSGERAVDLEVVNIIGSKPENFTSRQQTFAFKYIKELQEDPEDTANQTILRYIENDTELAQYIINDTLANIIAAINA